MSSSSFTMAQAKRDFSIGHMDTFHIQRNVVDPFDHDLGEGWQVWLKAGTASGPLLAARGSKAREFKTLDAAIAALEQIGFKVETLFRG